MMRSRSIAFLLSVLFVVFMATSAQDKGLTMSGNVTDSRSHQPVEGAKVTVVGNKANPEITDHDGNFILTFSGSTREGEVVRVRIEKTGYKVYEVNKPVSPTMPLQFSIDRIAATAQPRGTSRESTPTHPLSSPTAPTEKQQPPNPVEQVRTEAISLIRNMNDTWDSFANDFNFWNETVRQNKGRGEATNTRDKRVLQLTTDYQREYRDNVLAIRDKLMGHIHGNLPKCESQEGRERLYKPVLYPSGSMNPWIFAEQMLDIRLLLNEVERENNLPLSAQDLKPKELQ